MRRWRRKDVRWPALAALLVGASAACAAEAGQASDPARSTPPPATPEAALGDSLVAAWIEEAGGLAAWDDLRSARFTVTTVWYDSLA